MGFNRLVVFAAAALFLAATDAGAQDAPVVAGRVTEGATGRPVSGAVVRASGTGATTLTDLDGRFRLRVPLPQTLRVVHPGFAPRSITVEVPPPAGTLLELELLVEPVPLAGITVEASRAQPATTPRYEVSPVGVGRVPPLAEPDIFRAIVTLPGIEQPNGWRSAFHVRGGASDEALVLLDGIPLAEPYHMLGLFSGVQLGVVEGATLHLGAPPVHFADRLSGIIEIRTTIPDSAFYRVHASLLSAGAITGQRWDAGGRTGSLLLAGRYATTQLIGQALDLGSYGFADANLRLRQDLSEGLSLDVSGFINGDWITDLSGNHGDDPEEVGYRPDNHWGNRAGRIGLIRQTAAGWRARGDIAYSDYRIDFRDVPRSGDGAAKQIVDARSSLVKAGIGLEAALGIRHRVTIGGEVEREVFDHHWAGAVEEFSDNVPPSYDYIAAQSRGALYLANTWTPGQGVNLSFGARALLLPGSETNRTFVAPRLGFSWHPMVGAQIFGSAGRTLQTTTQAEEPREGNLGSPRFALEQPNRADVVELGAEWRVRGSSSVRATGFGKRYGRIAQLDSASVLLYPSQAYPTFRFGRGRSSGVEMLLSHPGTRFGAQAAYTFTHTRVDFGGIEVPPDWDTPHSLRALASLGVGNGWRVNSAFSLRSGLPYTPVLGTVLLPQGPDSDRSVRRSYILGATNSRRLPPARRLDVGAEKSGRVGTGTYTARMQMLNVLGDRSMLRVNPGAYYDYGFRPQPLDDAYDRSIPFLPSLGLEVHF